VIASRLVRVWFESSFAAEATVEGDVRARDRGKLWQEGSRLSRQAARWVSGRGLGPDRSAT